MGRAPCCDKAGLKKGPWTPEEDQKLVAYINSHGHGSWRALPKKAGLLRCGKSCRLRWTNYLRPDIKRGRFSPEEEQMIIHLHAIMGNRWSAIAGHLEGRTDNEIKNYWNTHLKKRLLQMGIDPVTHEPRLKSSQHWFDPGLLLESKALVAANILPCSSSSSGGGASSTSHLAQWENARLEAEARLARDYLRFQFHHQNDVNLHEHQLWSQMMALNQTQQQELPIDLATQLQQQQQQSLSQSLSPTSTLWTPEGSMSPSSSFPESENLFHGASASIDDPAPAIGEVYDPEASTTAGLDEIQIKPESFSVLEWADAGPDQSRDYWSNLLKLVGSC